MWRTRRTLWQLLSCEASVMPDIDKSTSRIVTYVHHTATISPNSRQALPKKLAAVGGMHTSDNETLLPHKQRRRK